MRGVENLITQKSLKQKETKQVEETKMIDAYTQYKTDAHREWIAVLSRSEWEREGSLSLVDLRYKWFGDKAGKDAIVRSIIDPDLPQWAEKINKGVASNPNPVENKFCIAITGSAGLLRLPAMIAAGRVKANDKLSIVGKPDSDAYIIDSKHVSFNGEAITWNVYGERLTGHVAVNIYKHVLVNGVLLNSLR